MPKTKEPSYIQKEKLNKRRKKSKLTNLPLHLVDDALIEIIDEYKKRIPSKRNLQKILDTIYSDYIRLSKSKD